MRGSTAPGIVLGFFHHAGMDRVLLNITQACPQVMFVESGREEPALPQVVVPVVLFVHTLRVSHVDNPDRLPHAVRIPRCCHEVNVIGHEAVTEDIQLIAS